MKKNSKQTKVVALLAIVAVCTGLSSPFAKASYEEPRTFATIAMELSDQELLQELEARKIEIAQAEQELRSSTIKWISGNKYYVISNAAKVITAGGTLYHLGTTLRKMSQKEVFQNAQARSKYLRSARFRTQLGTLAGWMLTLGTVIYMSWGLTDELQLNEKEKIEIENGLSLIKQELYILERTIELRSGKVTENVTPEEPVNTQEVTK
ncbi:MAG: hypothetical protein AB7F43_01225 [Bacteriovoracia bacterium]